MGIRSKILKFTNLCCQLYKSESRIINFGIVVYEIISYNFCKVDDDKFKSKFFMNLKYHKISKFTKSYTFLILQKWYINKIIDFSGVVYKIINYKYLLQMSQQNLKN